MSDQSSTPDTDILSRAMPAATSAHSMDSTKIARHGRGKKSTNTQKQMGWALLLLLMRGNYPVKAPCLLHCLLPSITRVEESRNTISSFVNRGNMFFSCVLNCAWCMFLRKTSLSFRKSSMNSWITQMKRSAASLCAWLFQLVSKAFHLAEGRTVFKCHFTTSLYEIRSLYTWIHTDSSAGLISYPFPWCL